MQAKHPLTVAVIVCLVAAGCVQSASPNSADSEGTVAAPPSFSDDTGSIHGLVLDDAQMPLAGAEIGIVETGASTTSDEAGAFTFNGLAPGTYALQFQMLGYESAARKVDVSIGEVTEIQALLVPIAIAEPYPETFIQDGHIQCSVALYPGVPTYVPGFFEGWISGANVCGIICIVQCLPAFGSDKFAIGYKTAAPGAQEFLLEMAWQSTQSAGSALSMGLEAQINVDEATYGGASGRSPLSLHVNATTVQAVENFTEVSCYEDSCEFVSRVFAEAETTGAENPVEYPDFPLVGRPSQKIDAGVTLDQRFTQYLTAFHYMHKPDGYTLMADA